jgi:tetratricopeptide (TPR) repeat protein
MGAPAASPGTLPVRIAAGLLVVAGLVAYRNSLGGPFVFDDLASILGNPSLRPGQPWWAPLFPPADFGLTVGGRPLVNVSLALNRAISGTDVWSYHAFNLLVHLLAGLTLFGLVRRALLLPGAAPGRRPADPTAVAFIAALLWLVHPVQTAAVTYVIQRAESLMALAYLLTLYAAVRVFEAEGRPPRVVSWRWRMVAVTGCAVGMACKEVMVTAPVAVLVLDATWGGGGFAAAWARRRAFHLALAATWGLLVLLVASTGGNRGGTFQFTWPGVRDYWLTQPEALTTYLRLVVWPVPLVFDYGRPAARALAEVWPHGFAVAAMSGLVIWAAARRPRLAAVAGLFCLVLLPTTVLPGTAQSIAEHRLYLPLAALTTLGAWALVTALPRQALVAGSIVAALAATGTIRRNAVYADDLTLWQETVDHRPASAVARSNLAAVAYQRGQWEAARVQAAEAVRLDANATEAWYNLGLAQQKLGRAEEALASFTAASRLQPRWADVWIERGAVAVRLQRDATAVDALRTALALAPQRADAHFLLGVALAASGRTADAIASYQRAIALRPAYGEAENNLGALLLARGDAGGAVAHLQRAVELAPKSADAHFNLGLALAARGDAGTALREYATTVRLAPDHAEARLNQAIALAQAGRWTEARAAFEEAGRRRPDSAELHANLALLLSELGEWPQAEEEFRTALRLRPDYALAHFGFGQALAQAGRWAEARAHFEETLRLVPNHAAARDLLAHWPEHP